MIKLEDTYGAAFREGLTGLEEKQQKALEKDLPNAIARCQGRLAFVQFHPSYYRQYRTFQYNDPHPRGWLDVARHLRLNPMNNGKCAYAAREYTLDNPVDRLILLARRCLI